MQGLFQQSVGKNPLHAKAWKLEYLEMNGRKIMKKKILIVAFCFALGLVFSAPAFADNLKEEAETIVDKARIVMEEVKNAPDSGAAYDLIRQSAGVVIIPDMFKGGFVVGGSYGKGVGRT